MGSPCVPDTTTATLSGADLHDVLRAQQGGIRNGEQAHAVGNLSHAEHATAQECHFAAVFGGKIENLLQTMNGTAEARYDQTAFAARKQFFQTWPDCALALGIARSINIGRIGHQQQYAALAVFGEGVEIEQFVVGWGGIDFEIAGVDHDAERRGDRQRHTTDDRVRYSNELDFEGPELDAVAGLDDVELNVVEHLVLVEAAFYQCERKLGAVDGNIQRRKQKWHAADVIFVAVRQDEAANHLSVLFQVGEVGRDNVDAEQFGIWEHHAGIDNDDVVTVTQCHGVHPKFAQTAYWDDV